MRERPSPLFQPWGRQAIRDLIKTQTRRVMKPQPPAWIEQFRSWPPSYSLELKECDLMVFSCGGEDYGPKPPHGQPGTIWYLKEPLEKVCGATAYLDGPMVVNRATGKMPLAWHWKRDTLLKRAALTSMFMPRNAARDFVTVTDVRVERVQDISDVDAIAEGLIVQMGDGTGGGSGYKWHGPGYQDAVTGNFHVNWRSVCCCDDGQRLMLTAERCAFRVHWDSINAAPKPANKNPYTGQPEKCYVSYPWENIRETRKHRGLTWYVVGNPWNFVYTFGGYVGDPGRPMEK